MKYDLIIIGSGPAGYVAAIRAGQTGLKTAIIEKGSIGGMCLNYGCIPTKALLESAKTFQKVKDAATFGVDGVDKKALSFNWKKAAGRANRIVGKLTRGVEFLLKKNGVEIIKGMATVTSPNSVSVENRLLETENIMLATGSKSYPEEWNVPEDKVLDIWSFLQLKELPANPMVYGHGPHAVEIVQFLHMIGKPVKLLVPNEELLPKTDDFLADFFVKKFKKEKLEVIYNAKIGGWADGKLKVNDEEIECDSIINLSWRKAVMPPSEIDITMEDGFVKVNENFKTNIPSIYAVGDMNGILKVAHAASIQGLNVVNQIKGIPDKVDFSRNPINMYTYPEMAQIGKTESELKAEGVEYKISDFPLTGNGKALTEGYTDGMVRILSETKYGEVVGTQIISLNATDMIAEAAAVMELEGTVYDVAKIVHAHPTTSEIFLEAGYDTFDMPIHK
jgi:dihydrolipoamide dehydrogenase